MNYIVHILVMITLYSILGMSLNIVVGYAGMLGLCQGAFYGIGAYTCTVLMMHSGAEFLPAVLGAIAMTGLISIIVALVTMRFRDDFFMLGTLAFQMIVSSVLYNWVDLTRGPYGIAGIPKPVILNISISTLPAFLVISTACASIVGFIHWQISRSPYGRTLQGVRDDELAARALGKNPIYYRITAFAASGCLAAIAGSLYASYASYIDPTSFGLDEAVLVLMVVIIGGTGSTYGPFLGAVFVVLLPELLRICNVPSTLAPNLRQVVFGLCLVLVMRFRPQGIAGRYSFD